MPEEGSLYHSRKRYMLALCVCVCTAEGAYSCVCKYTCKYICMSMSLEARRSVTVLTCDSASWCWISRCISLLPLPYVGTKDPTLGPHSHTQALQHPSCLLSPLWSSFSLLLSLLTACEEPRAHASLFPTELEVLASLL